MNIPLLTIDWELVGMSTYLAAAVPEELQSRAKGSGIENLEQLDPETVRRLACDLRRYATDATEINFTPEGSSAPPRSDISGGPSAAAIPKN